MESKTKQTYLPPEVIVVEIQPDCALLQASKPGYGNGGDQTWP